MTSKATWNDLVKIVRGLSIRQNGLATISGIFTIADENDLASLRVCVFSEDDTHLRLAEDIDPNSVKIGQTIEVEVSPRFGFGLLAVNIDKLLLAQNAKIKAPSHFFLLEEGLNHSDQVDDTNPLAKYRGVLDFIQMLKSTAAFLDPDEAALIFINKGKFEVPINYTKAELCKLLLADLQALTRIIQPGIHEKVCRSIMAEAVISMTQHMPANARFQYLLNHLTDLKKRYEDGFNLFASGFSYEKIRDQVEAARVEYTGRIHKVLSDIQNQLLTIPVATIVVVTQMKEAKDMGAAFWVNSAILFGCWVFSTLMALLLHNQSTTLKVLKDEINRQKTQMDKELAMIAKSFDDTFDALISRALFQRIIIWVVDGIIAVGFLCSHIVYIKLTQPALDWICHLFPYLTKFF